MEITYGIVEHGSGDLEPCETLAIAFAMREGDDEVVMLADGTVLGSLPEVYNRVVVVPDGRKITTAVMLGSQVQEEGNVAPLSDDAPLLVIDHHRNEVTLTEGGQSRWLYGEPPEDNPLSETMKSPLRTARMLLGLEYPADNVAGAISQHFDLPREKAVEIVRRAIDAGNINDQEV